MREGELVPGDLAGREPLQLDEVVARPRIASTTREPRQAEDDAAVVGLVPETEEPERLDLEAGLFADFAPQRFQRLLALLEKAAGQIPTAAPRLEAAAAEQHASLVVEEYRLRSRHGARVGDEAAGGAGEPRSVAGERRGAAGTILPGVERTHDPTI